MQAGRLPDAIVACVGGGSNAIGLFHPFVGDKDVKIYGVEAGGEKAGPARAIARRRGRGRGREQGQVPLRERVREEERQSVRMYE